MKMTQFVNLITIDSKDAIKNLSQMERRASKVLKFTSRCSLSDVKSVLLTLASKDFPHLFIFAIENSNYDALITTNEDRSKDVQDIHESIQKICANRPALLLIIAENGTAMKFLHKPKSISNFILIKSENFKNFGNFSDFLICFTKERIEEFEEEIVENLFSFNNSTVVLRFLKSLKISENLFYNLLIKCVAKGSKDDILAILDVPFEDDGRFLNLDAQKLLSETFNIKEILMDSLSDVIANPSNASILKIAIENSNEVCIEFLMTHCTHFIQLLPLEHCIDISTMVFNVENYQLLCKLLKSCDFPFPNNLHVSSKLDKDIQEIIKQRNEFHGAVSSDDSKKLLNFIKKCPNLKYAFNVKNESALKTTITHKKFKQFVQLKSLGFILEDDDIFDLLTLEDRSNLETMKWNQTIKNVDKAGRNNKKSSMMLAARSRIHNAMSKEKGGTVEKEYQKIRKWFDDLSEIYVCSLLLDAACQSEELQIIFDFDSESVENVDLKNTSESLGTIYPNRKWIFIGAKGTDQSRMQQIKGVIIHELCHYVMRIVYENDENPFYKGDEMKEAMFLSIVQEIKEMIKKDNQNGMRKEEMIILSVYTAYDEIDRPQELIVRPSQIYAQCKEETRLELTKKYKSLFEFHDNMIFNDVKNFCLQDRQCVRNINKTAGLMNKIEKEREDFKFEIISAELFNSQCTIVTTNISKIVLIKVYKHIQQENLPDTKNVFITLSTLRSEKKFSSIKQALRIYGLKFFVDCTTSSLEGVEDSLKQMIDNQQTKFFFIVPSDEYSLKLHQILSINKNKIRREVIKFKFCDLTSETQANLIKREVEFQNNSKIPLDSLMSFDCLDSQIIDDNILKQLVEKANITVNSRVETENSDKELEILFQSRKLIKAFAYSESSSSENSGSNTEITQENLFDQVKNMKAILISDLPGSGKSWMLKNISRIIRKENPTKWVTYVDLREYEQMFKEPNLPQEFSKFMIEKILKLNSKFQDNIFINLYKNGKTCIIFDQIDILSRDCIDYFITLWSSFEFNEGNQLWIGVRNNVDAFDTKCLNFDAVYRLNEFTKDSGMKFIALSWARNELKQQNLDYNNKDLVIRHSREEKFQIWQQKWSKVVLKIHKHFVGLPQFYEIIAVYGNKIDLDKIPNTHDFFREFMIHMCNKVQDNCQLNAMDVHKYLAIRSYFPEIENVENFRYNASGINYNYILRCDLVFKNENTIVFHHESYREYFAADFIASYPPSFIDQQICSVFKNLFVKVLNSNKYLVIRALINDALCDELKFRNFEQFIRTNRITFGQKIDDIFDKIFTEGLENISTVFIKIFRDNSYNEIKRSLYRTVHHTIEISSIPESLQKYLEVVINCFNNDDLKKFIKKTEIVHKIVISKLDFIVLKQLTINLEKKIDTHFVREVLTEPQRGTQRNLFHQLCLHRKFDEENYSMFFEIMIDIFSKREVLALIQNHDETGNHVLHTCIFMKNNIMLEFMWKKFQLFSPNDAEFKKIILQKTIQNDANILHLAAVCKSTIFLETLWKLLLITFVKKDEMCQLLVDKNTNGNTFVHLLINGQPALLELTINVLKDNFSYMQNKKILGIKDDSGRNALQIALYKNRNLKIHQTLWEIFEYLYKPKINFLEILKDPDNHGNSIFEIVTQFLRCSEQQDIHDLTWDEYQRYLVSNMNGFNIVESTFNVNLYGKPECIINLDSAKNEITTCIDPLERILGHKDVKDAKIVVLSTFGVFRKGKSFFLNYCLRFLYANYKSINFPENPLANRENWMGEKNLALQGFSWRSGSARDTLGIIIWNDVFLHTYEDTGKKVAIIVVDTEGLFNNNNILSNELKIAVLSTLLSSIHVFSTLDSIQDQFEFLHLATECAKLLIDGIKKTQKPFQKLAVIVRDWVNSYYFQLCNSRLCRISLLHYLKNFFNSTEVSLDDHLYGLESGEGFLETFQPKNDQNVLRNSYEQLCCTLLPHPGSKVTGGKMRLKKYDGNWEDMDEDFKDELEKIIKELLKPENLKIKKINGIEQKAAEYLEHVQYFINLDNENLNVESIYEATIQNLLTDLVNSLFKKYREMFINEQKYLRDIKEKHSCHYKNKQKILSEFTARKKVGDKKNEVFFFKKLEDKINIFYNDFFAKCLKI